MQSAPCQHRGTAEICSSAPVLLLAGKQIVRQAAALTIDTIAYVLGAVVALPRPHNCPNMRQAIGVHPVCVLVRPLRLQLGRLDRRAVCRGVYVLGIALPKGACGDEGLAGVPGPWQLCCKLHVLACRHHKWG